MGFIGFILGGSAFVMLSPKPIFGVVGSARPRETRLCLDRPIIIYYSFYYGGLGGVGGAPIATITPMCLRSKSGCILHGLTLQHLPVLCKPVVICDATSGFYWCRPPAICGRRPQDHQKPPLVELRSR